MQYLLKVQINGQINIYATHFILSNSLSENCVTYSFILLVICLVLVIQRKSDQGDRLLTKRCVEIGVIPRINKNKHMLGFFSFV